MNLNFLLKRICIEKEKLMPIKLDDNPYQIKGTIFTNQGEGLVLFLRSRISLENSLQSQKGKKNFYKFWVVLFTLMEG